MTTVSVEGETLVVTVEGADKFWSLRSRLEIPLAHVKSVRADPSFVRQQRYAGLKIAGARLPGVITAGSFRQEGDTVFWDVHNPDKAIVVELTHEHYARLVIEVDNPDAALAMIGKKADAED